MSARNFSEQVKLAVVAGAAGATNIAVTGLEVGDTIESICDITTPAQISLAGLVITAGNFKITAATTGKTLIVKWTDKNAG